MAYLVECVAISLPLALYQNTGWEQFSYRFLLDILPYLMVALALGSRPFGVWFKIALVWGVLINLLGAVTFQRPVAKAFYGQIHNQDGGAQNARGMLDSSRVDLSMNREFRDEVRSGHR